MYRFKAVVQYDKCLVLIHDKMKMFRYTLVCELTQQNNIHYHGLVELKDLNERDDLLNRFRGSLVFGRMTCSQIINEKKWEDYLVKSINETSALLKRAPILQDDFNLFTTNEPEDGAEFFKKDTSKKTLGLIQKKGIKKP